MPRRKPPAPRITTYWDRAQWPLQSLYFLLLPLLLYELGSLAYAPVHEVRLPPILAESLLDDFFRIFGVSGYYVPGIVVVVILISLHIVRRDPWKPEPRLYLMMFIESVALALPLFMFMLVLFREADGAQTATRTAMHLTGMGHVVGGGGGGGGGWLAAAIDARSNGSGAMIPNWQAGIVFSLGAGIYEELLFRLIAIALIHLVLVDLLALPRKWGAVGAVVLSAVAFALYHFTSQTFVWGKFLFYTAAGLYFAVIYLLRGFGIVAATHAMYDVIWVIMTYTLY